ncbi:MAG: translation initiation factor 2 [Deltaproteobacteria bacterium]|jgi:hypothetical protein|nr:translation initiation factor 2 [Deltaproteobacteria bacterium]
MKYRKLFLVCCISAFAFAVSAGTATSAPAKKAQQAKNVPAAPAPPVQVSVSAPDGVPDNVKLELASVSKTLVGNAARTIMPSSRAKAVAPGGNGGHVASYVEVDCSDVRAEVVPSATAGQYVGSIRYVENQYECPGKTAAEALKAECRVVKARRMNELIRYEKGKWHY